MPRVPVLPRQIAPAPLPTLRIPRIPEGAPAAAFQPPAPVDLSGAAQAMERIATDERQKADQIAVLDSDNQLSELRIRLQSEAMARRGKDAQGATPAAAEEWTKRASEIESSLRGDTQKLAFRRIAGNQWAALHAAIESHASQQADAYDQQTATASLTLSYQDALANYSDPAKVAGAIEKGRAVATDFARRRGYSDAQTQAMLAGLVSKAHAGVFERYLDNGQDLAGIAYFAAHKGELVGKDLLDAEQLADTASVRGESQRIADDITSTATTLSDALTRARAVQEPRVRDAVEPRVRRFFADQATAERQAQSAAFHEASGILERTRDFEAIPLKLREKLSPEDNGALQRREDQLRHPVRVTNPGLFNSLLNAFSLPGSRDWVLTHDLGQYREQLAEPDYHRVLELQREGRAADSRFLASESRRNAGQAQRAQQQAEKTAAARRMLEQNGIHVPPTVPGAPIVMPGGAGSPTGASRIRPAPGKPTPAAWITRAERDSSYRDYLKTMGWIVVDATPNAPAGSTP